MIQNQGNDRKVKEGDVVNWRDEYGDIHCDKVDHIYISAMGYECVSLYTGKRLRMNELL